MEIKDIINDLNFELHEQHGKTEFNFSYLTNGHWEGILFEEEIIWDTQNDYREWIDAINDYEPMTSDYVKKIFNAYLNRIYKLKLK